MATRNAFLVGCLIGAVPAAAAPAAGAALPRTGSWDSRPAIQPAARTKATVTFEVRGSGSRRVVERVAVPAWCPGVPEPSGVYASDAFTRVRADGRFTSLGGDFVVRGRFVGATRAEVRVRAGDCSGTRRYVVRHIRPRVPVRTGRYLTLVSGGTASFELEVDAFGREVMVEYLSGSVTTTCSDGSQRALSLLGAEAVSNAPIGPAGRFEAASTPPLTVRISGTFDHGSVAALLNVTSVQPDGVSCRVRGIPVVGALAYPF